MYGELRDPPFHTYEVKHTKMIKFSSGGQYLACVDNKKIRLYSTFGLDNVLHGDDSIQCPAPGVSDICFSDMDTRMTVVTEEGFL